MNSFANAKFNNKLSLLFCPVKLQWRLEPLFRLSKHVGRSLKRFMSSNQGDFMSV